MNHKRKEFLKSIILSILVLASLLQVGILWGYQSHGLPFNFLSAFFSTIGSNSLVDINKAKGEYFLPYQVIVSEGFDASHWIVPRKTDTYNKLWNEAKSYLKDILGSKTQIAPTDELWGDIVTKKAVIFEFKANIKISLMNFFLDIPNTPSNIPSGITKIAILPWDDTIYILDDSKVYRCNTPIIEGQMKKDDYKDIIDKLTQDSSQRSYSVIKELIPNEKKALYPIRQDILIANETSNMFENYHNISFSNPENLSVRKDREVEDLEEIAGSILGNEKDSYDLAVDSSTDAAVFKNLNNIYKVYKDGLLEYKYLSSGDDESDKGNISDAFTRALEFISKRKQLTSGVEYYLSGVKEEKGYYEFTFDYILNSTPVFINYNSESQDKTLINNAVTITSNSKRVVNCWWLIRKFTQDNEAGDYYVNFSSFISLLDNMFQYNGSLNFKNFSINDISVSYEVKSGKENQSIEPEWVITTKNNEYYAIPMRKKKGD